MDEVHSRPPSASSNMSEDEIRSNCTLIEDELECSDELLPSVIIPTRAVKRHHETESDESGRVVDEEGFTTVTRKTKRFATDKSKTPNALINESNRNDVCLSSYEVLPKQIGLARLFKSEGITNASKIRYKNAYKVIISFDKREDALELINNKKMIELKYRCHFTTEVDLSYGVVKYLELDITDEDLMKSFSSECKIESVRRLKRLSDKGEWVASETVRFGFKSSTLPEYINGYDCRFKVESYTFPVSQCSFCWRYGHTTRTCPNNKTICPKCGGNHGNCETTQFRCVNCKGRHISFSKLCPQFLKEKKIRETMSKHNVTYKMALSMYLDNKYYQAETRSHAVYPEETQRSENVDLDTSYSAALRQTAKVPRIQKDSSSEVEIGEAASTELKIKKQKTNKKQKNVLNRDIHVESWQNSGDIRSPVEEKEESEAETENRRKKSNYFTRLLHKLKEIVMMNNSFEDKIQSVMKVIFDEVVSFIVKNVSNGEVFNKLLGLFKYG